MKNAANFMDNKFPYSWGYRHLEIPVVSQFLRYTPTITSTTPRKNTGVRHGGAFGLPYLSQGDEGSGGWDSNTKTASGIEQAPVGIGELETLHLTMERGEVIALRAARHRWQVFIL